MSLLFEHVQLDKGNKAVWISIDSADNEANQFLSLFCSALVKTGVADATLVTRANNSSANTDLAELTRKLLEVVEQCPNDVFVFIDDFHFISDSAILLFINTLLQINLNNLHLVISSRVQPKIDTNYLYAQGLHYYLDAEKLRFTLSETNDLLKDFLTVEQIESLHTQTEGWPVAIQLSRLWYIQNPNSSPTKLLTNNLDTLSNYLREQVFDKFDITTQNFLLKTSFLDSFNIDLANFVCANEEGSHAISQLKPYESLIISLDNTGSSFKYHQLFADFLQQTFTTLFGQGEVRRLRHRAAQWFADENYLSESVSQYVRAKDKSAAVSLIAKSGGWELILSKGIGFVESVLSHFSESDFVSYESLGLLRCYFFLKMGKVVAAQEQLLITKQLKEELWTGKHFDRKEDRDLLVIELLVEAYLDNLTEQGITDKLSYALEVLPQDDHLARGVLLAIESLLQNQYSNFKEAEQKAEICTREMRLANCWLGVNYITLHHGQSLAYRGLLRPALNLFNSACLLAEEHLGLDSGLQSMAMCLTAEIEYQLGNVDLAQSLLHKGKPALFQRDCWYDIYVVVFRLAINLSILNNDEDGGIEYLEEGRKIAAERKLHRLSILLDVMELKLAHTYAQEQRFEDIHHKIIKSELWKDTILIWSAKEEYHYIMALHFLRKNNSRKVQLHVNELLSICAKNSQSLYIIKGKFISALSSFSLNDLKSAFTQAAEAVCLASSLQTKQLIHDLPDGIESLLVKLRAQSDFPLNDKSLAFIDTILKEQRTTTESKLSQLGLSHREQQLIPLLMKGKTNKEISSELGITENTVKFHLKNLFLKINVKNRNEASVYFLTAN